MGGEGDQAEVASGLRVLSDRNFWPYFAGNLASNCGSWFQNLAQALLIFRLTGSIFLVGAVNFAQFAGAFVLAPWAGSAADRFDRRRLMIVTQVVSVVITGVLAMLSAADLASAPVVIGLVLLLGGCIAFYVPAMQALVPLLVPTHELAGAVALNSVTFNLARAIGPVVGAVVIAHFGITAAFGLNSASYLLLIVGLLMVQPRPQAPRPQVRPKLSESIRLVLGDAQLSALLIAVMALSITTDPLSTLTPGFATQLFQQPDTVVGWLIGAFGLGAVLAAFSTSRGVSKVWRRLSAMLTLEGARHAPVRARAIARVRVSGSDRERLRLSGRQHHGDDRAATPSRRLPTGARHGVVEHLVPRCPPDREPRRRRSRVGHGTAGGVRAARIAVAPVRHRLRPPPAMGAPFSAPFGAPLSRRLTAPTPAPP